MNPSKIFILRPVATTLLMVALFLCGVLAYQQLPIAALPEVDYPTIQVVTFYPGASPEVMATTVTAPLESEFGEITGLTEMSSSSSGEASLITLRFSLHTSLDVAQQDVQAAIDVASSLLPSDLPSPPVFSRVNPADAPILTLAILSQDLPLPQVQDLVETRIAQKIAQVSGVGRVSLAGGQRPAVRVQVNPSALAAHNLSLEEVRTTILNTNLNSPKGSFEGPKRAITLDANDQLMRAEQYQDLIVRYENGAPIRLSDIATVSHGAENKRLAAWADRTPAIIINIQRQPGANVIATVAHINALLPELQKSLPGNVRVAVLTDRTLSIRAAIHAVTFELMLAIALVVMVTFIFLRKLWATVIPSITVPLALVATFSFMYLAGFSINNLTLMALTIATGFVIDDAIVMLENIARHLEAGESPHIAALKGAKQIGFTIISLTFSLVAVLIPLLFMQEVAGRLFREFAITLAVAILISGAVSLSLTPMLCAKLLRPHKADAERPWARAVANVLTGLVNYYAQALQYVLRHQKTTLWVALGTLLLSAVLYAWLPKGLFPEQDAGIIQAVTEGPQSSSFAEMTKRQQQVVDLVLQDPAVASLSSFIGVDVNNSTLNTGRLLINLRPHKVREDSAQQVIQRLQKTLNALSGTQVYLQSVQDLSLEDRVSRTQYQMSLRASNTEAIKKWTPLLLGRLRSLPELADVASDMQDQGLELWVEVDRDQAARLGVSMSDINQTLYNAFGQRQISTIFTQSNQYRVVLEVAAQQQLGPAALDSLYVPNNNNQLIRLSSLARVQERSMLLSINRNDQFPAATLSFNLAPEVSLSQAVRAIERAEQALAIPASINIDFRGSALAFESSLTSTLLLILASIVTMYLVLGILYESFIHPLTILSTLPSAAVGALLALLVAGQELGMVAIIGIILLIGIVKKNAILMIDFALEAQRAGSAPDEAIYQACLLRFRPIIMTTMAALLGALPLMLASGSGAEIRQPLGLTLVGGLLLSQLLTLFTTPVIYLAFERLRGRLSS